MLSDYSLMRAALLENDAGNVDAVKLSWLDQSINDPVNDCIRQKLHLAVKSLKTFDKPDACRTYIESMSPFDRTLLIVSGRLGRSFVPMIAHCRQVSSIYVYCMDQDENEIWARDYRKVQAHCRLPQT